MNKEIYYNIIEILFNTNENYCDYAVLVGGKLFDYLKPYMREPELLEYDYTLAGYYITNTSMVQDWEMICPDNVLISKSTVINVRTMEQIAPLSVDY